MNAKEKKLNHKAYLKVTENLMRAGFIKTRLERETKEGVHAHITLTTKGTRLIAWYATGLSSIGIPTRRKIEMLNSFLGVHAMNYLRETGQIE